MKIKKEGWESSRAAPLSAHHSSKLELWRKTSTWKSSGMSSALSLIPERPPCCARPGANPPSTPLLLFPEHSQGIPRSVPASAEVPVPPPAQGAKQTLPASTKPGSQGSSVPTTKTHPRSRQLSLKAPAASRLAGAPAPAENTARDLFCFLLGSFFL